MRKLPVILLPITGDQFSSCTKGNNHHDQAKEVRDGMRGACDADMHQCLDGGNRHIDLNNVPHPRRLPMNPRHPWVPDCKRRRSFLKELVQGVVVSPWAEPDNVGKIELWYRLKGFSAPPRHSDLRGDKTPTLEEYRKHMGIKNPPPQPEMMATTHDLDHFYEELSTLTPERVRFLYQQHWEKCRLEPNSLPSTLDAQYLGTTLQILKDMKKGK